MTQNNSEPIWTLGPISVKRTTDFLALVAFMLACISLLTQFRDYVRGADVILFATEQVTFGSSKVFKIYWQNNDQFVQLGARMSYVNDASAGYNGAIRRQFIRFEVDGKKYQYLAHQMMSTSADSNELKVEKKADSGPFTLNAGSAVSNEVLFVPHRLQCADGDLECITSLPGLRWEEFKAAIKKSPIVMITLLSDVYDKPTLSVRCTVTLNANDLAAIEKSEWSAPDCIEDKKKSFVEKIWG